MTVKRITMNMIADDPEGMRAFYQSLFGLDILMQLDFVTTLGGAVLGDAVLGDVVQSRPMVNISDASAYEPQPDLSIEVEDVDGCHKRAVEMGAEITLSLRDEPWGVRRFFLRDPAGYTVNVMAHSGAKP